MFIKNPEQYIGRKFGRVEVLNFFIGKEGAKSRTLFNCMCICGNKRTYNSSELKRKKSCGCEHRENMSKKNKGKPPASRQAYGLSSAKGYYSNYKARAKEANLEFALTFEDFMTIVKKNCYYCGIVPMSVSKRCKFSYGAFVSNGIDRIDNKEGYKIDNCVTCCKWCNFSKHTRTQKEFIIWAFKLAKNLKENEELSKLVTDIDLREVMEVDDNTALLQNVACAGGACEII